MAMPVSINSDGSLQLGDYAIYNITAAGLFTACYYDQNFTEEATMWKTINHMDNSVPTFITQICITILLKKLLTFLLKPFHQPRFVCDLLSGILLGPNGFGMIPEFREFINPLRGNRVLETIGNFGLVLYMFLVGLEMDITTIKGIQKKAIGVAVAGILPPLFVGFYLYTLLMDAKEDSSYKGGEYFWAMSLSVTSFPDLARVLSDLKILHTDLGRTALSAGLINDLFSWLLLILAVTLVNASQDFVYVLPTLLFVLFCWFALRPALSWLTSKTSKDGQYNDYHIHLILSGVLLCGLTTDSFGSQSLVGALIFGLIIPNGELGLNLITKFESFVNEILMPAFFITTGARTDIFYVFNFANFQLNILPLSLILLASSVKFISTFAVSFYNRASARDSITLGLLMSTKGVLSLIILNAGRNVEYLNNKGFTTMAVTILFMTGLVTPLIKLMNQSTKQFKQYKHRTMEKSKPGSELRILACVHTTRNVPGIINLLEISNATKNAPLCVFAVHLVEMTGRASAMLIIHDTSKNVGLLARERAASEQIISAFKDYESSNAESVSVQPLTAVSPYASIDEDICALAEDKRVTLILIPFHKFAKADGTFQEENTTIRNINQNLLAKSPCSIGILVDRGFGPSARGESVSGRIPNRSIALIFIGGPDDREALAYAWRMAGYQCTDLIVIRFIAGKDVSDINASTLEAYGYDEFGNEKGVLTAITDMEKEKQIDDDYINEFRFRIMSESNVSYIERQSNSGEQTVTAIRTSFADFDMYIVGRGQGSISPLTSGLSDWSDCAELGGLGDTLVTSEFAQHATVVVIQQHAPASAKATGPMSWRLGDQFA